MSTLDRLEDLLRVAYPGNASIMLNAELVRKVVRVARAAPYAIEVIETLMFYIKPGTSDCEHATKAANDLRAAISDLEKI
jgi:hypothetical protein